VEAKTDRPTDSTILVKLIARVCTTGGNLHRFNLPDMNQIGPLEQQEELRRLSQQTHFLNGKARGEAKRKKLYFQLLRRVRRLRRRLLRGLESVRRNLEARADLLPSRRLMGEEALCLIAEDLAAGTKRQRLRKTDHGAGESAGRRKDHQPERLGRLFYR
jgi:hypothetical protein